MARLTIPDEQTVAEFTVDVSTSAFPITFSLFAKADITVIIDGTALDQSDFTFTGTLLEGGGYDGGTVTLNTAVDDVDVRIERNVAPARTSNFAPSASVPVQVVDQAINRLTAVQQDQKRILESADVVALGLVRDEAVDAQIAAEAARDAAIASDAGQKLDKNLASLASIKAKSGTSGDVALSALYGSPFDLGSPRRIQSSIIAADDELYQVTASSGTWAAQIGPLIGTLRKKAADNKARACSKLAIISSLASNVIVNVLGDSIAYGQNNPALTGGDRIATGFGDGSLHVWTQAASPWPAELEDRLTDLYGPKFTVNNRGFSGDTLENLYTRHRTAPTCDITIVSGMVNDVLTATNNGGVDTVSQLGLLQATGVATPNVDGYYVIQNYTDALFKILAREILRGSWPFVAIEAPFQGATGYDGTTYAAGRLLQQMAGAARSVAAALGLPVIDFAERVSAYALTDMTFDGVHPTTLGHQVRGAVAAATIMGESQPVRPVITGNAHVSVNVTRDPVVGYRIASVMNNTANAASFGRPFVSATEAADLVVAPGETVYVAVYLETDEAEIYPLGYMSNGGSGSKTFDQIVNFGITQPPPKLDQREEAGTAGFETLANAKTSTVSTSAAKHFNHPAVAADLLRLVGRGWQVFTLSSSPSGGGSFVLSGFAIGDFGKWRGMTLAAGFEQFGDIQPAYKLESGLLYTRGVIACAAPTTPNQTITTLTGYSRITFYDSIVNLTTPWSFVELGWAAMALIWKSSPASNLFNLAALPPRPVLVLDDA